MGQEKPLTPTDELHERSQINPQEWPLRVKDGAIRCARCDGLVLSTLREEALEITQRQLSLAILNHLKICPNVLDTRIF